MREFYRNNPEKKKQAAEQFKQKYYINKYGMTKEEYLKIKNSKQQDEINQIKANIENNKSRALTFEKFLLKREQCLTVQCN